MQEEQEEIKEIKRTLNDLTAKFEDKFDELSKSVEEQQENAEEKINENAVHITSLEKNAGATTSLDPRVAALEPKLEGLQTRIATLETKKKSDE